MALSPAVSGAAAGFRDHYAEQTAIADRDARRRAVQRQATLDQINSDFQIADVNTLAPQPFVATPQVPTAGLNISGGSGQSAAVGGEGDIEAQLMGPINQAVTNKFGQAAALATAIHESGLKQENIVGEWADGKAGGKSGGGFSWYDSADGKVRRLTALKNFAKTNGLDYRDPATQGKFFVYEAQQTGLLAKLNKATSVEEANRIMAGAWRFKGYKNEKGGEYLKRQKTAEGIFAKLQNITGAGGADSLPGGEDDLAPAPDVTPVPVPAVTPVPVPAPAPAPAAGVQLGGIPDPAAGASRSNLLGGLPEVDPEGSTVTRYKQRSARSRYIRDTSREISNALDKGSMGLRGDFFGEIGGLFTDSPKTVETRKKVTAAADWFNSSEAFKYFEDNPEQLDVARNAPLTVHNEAMRNGGKPPTTTADRKGEEQVNVKPDTIPKPKKELPSTVLMVTPNKRYNQEFKEIQQASRDKYDAYKDHHRSLTEEYQQLAHRARRLRAAGLGTEAQGDLARMREINREINVVNAGVRGLGAEYRQHERAFKITNAIADANNGSWAKLETLYGEIAGVPVKVDPAEKGMIKVTSVGPDGQLATSDPLSVGDFLKKARRDLDTDYRNRAAATAAEHANLLFEYALKGELERIKSEGQVMVKDAEGRQWTVKVDPDGNFLAFRDGRAFIIRPGDLKDIGNTGVKQSRVEEVQLPTSGLKIGSR